MENPLQPGCRPDQKPRTHQKPDRDRMRETFLTAWVWNHEDIRVRGLSNQRLSSAHVTVRQEAQSPRHIQYGRHKQSASLTLRRLRPCFKQPVVWSHTDLNTGRSFRPITAQRRLLTSCPSVSNSTFKMCGIRVLFRLKFSVLSRKVKLL